MLSASSARRWVRVRELMASATALMLTVVLFRIPCAIMKKSIGIGVLAVRSRLLACLLAQDHADLRRAASRTCDSCPAICWKAAAWERAAANLTEEYIAAQLARSGAKPAGENGTYFQKVPLVGVQTLPESQLIGDEGRQESLSNGRTNSSAHHQPAADT